MTTTCSERWSPWVTTRTSHGWLAMFISRTDSDRRHPEARASPDVGRESSVRAAVAAGGAHDAEDMSVDVAGQPLAAESPLEWVTRPA
jgi:hypothetical protein